MALPAESKTHIREFNREKDLAQVEQLERRCEVGPSGNVSIVVDLMGDPICRIRHSPAYTMLVAEFGPEREIVGVIRGSIKTVVCGMKQHPADAKPYPVFTKAAYILGLRVSPTHRRLGIGLRLVQRLERWFKENGAEYAYMATEKENEASVKLFTGKCNFTKFRTPAILVQPVHYHSTRVSSRAKIVKLDAKQGGHLYRQCIGTTEFFPQDIDRVLENRLSLGTWVAYYPRGEDWTGLRSDSCKDIMKGIPNSWAILSVWQSNEVFKMQVRGAGIGMCMCAAATRLLDRTFPWLNIPSIPDVFRPFGFHFLYGLHAEGPNSGRLMTDLCWFAHNLAREKGCRLIVTEVSSCDPLESCIPHWDSFSCPGDLWCIKKLFEEPGEDDWTKSAPPLALFVDPREV